jgi:hypothetical protein
VLCRAVQCSVVCSDQRAKTVWCGSIIAVPAISSRLGVADTVLGIELKRSSESVLLDGDNLYCVVHTGRKNPLCQNGPNSCSRLRAALAICVQLIAI